MSEKKSIEVLVTIPIEEKQLSSIRDISKKLNVNHIPAREMGDISPSLWEKAEVLFTNSKFIPEPEMSPRLRWIQLNYAGINRVLTRPIVQNRQLVVTSSSGVIVSQVAEHVVFACLALGRKLPTLLKAQREHRWELNAREELTPRELRGSTVGIIGYGSIGREVARLLIPFGVKILATKKDPMHPEDDGYIQEGLGDPEGNLFERLYPTQALTEMLPLCDFVIVCVPLTPDTHHLFNTDVINSMKSSSYLVNISRGDVIDEPALIAALTQGKIAGAALDVFSREPLPPESPFWDMPNVIVSPHSAGLSAHLSEDAVNLFKENLKRYLNGETLFNQLDLNKGY